MSRYIEMIEWNNSGNAFKPFDYMIDLEETDDE